MSSPEQLASQSEGQRGEMKNVPISSPIGGRLTKF
jgi:hypothetical protein